MREDVFFRNCEFQGPSVRGSGVCVWGGALMIMYLKSTTRDLNEILFIATLCGNPGWFCF
jgi:hypothetical protein